MLLFFNKLWLNSENLSNISKKMWLNNYISYIVNDIKFVFKYK